MNKKLINEDIVNMKYLFGYKPGRVISEQDFDYTTDDYLDIDDTELDEGGKRHPERLVKHSNTNKLVGTHKHDTGFRPNRHGEELGFDIHSTDIPYGTKFGGVEVGDFDYNDDTELDEDMFDGWEDPDNFKSTLLTKRHKLDLDDEDEDEGTLFEQEETGTDRYMFFSNLEQIHRQTGILLEKDPNMISEILDNGHDWAQDHIATSKETIDQVFDFLMNEEKGDDDNFLK